VRPAIFHSKARATIKGFPPDVRRSIGGAIEDIQYGATLWMPLSRPMPSVAAGAQELRIRGGDGAFRVFYIVKADSGVIVFHAFQKKTQKTPMSEIELARKRLFEVLNG